MEYMKKITYDGTLNFTNELYKKMLNKAELFHNFIECRTISRCDFIYVPESEDIFFLEINTQPGMTRHFSMSPKVAAYFGISLEDIVKTLLEQAHFDLVEKC